MWSSSFAFPNISPFLRLFDATVLLEGDYHFVLQGCKVKYYANTHNLLINSKMGFFSEMIAFHPLKM